MARTVALRRGVEHNGSAGGKSRKSGLPAGRPKLTLSMNLGYALLIVKFSVVSSDGTPGRVLTHQLRRPAPVPVARFPRLSRTSGAQMKGRFPAAVVLVLVLAPTSGCTTIRERVWMNGGHKLYRAQKDEEAN